MRSSKPGVSPILQMLLDGFCIDPFAHSVMATLRDFRDMGSSDQSLHLLWQFHLGLVDLPPSSVSAILTSRLNALGWTWSGEGEITDQIGRLRLTTCGMAELTFRVQLGWEQWVTAQIRHRSTFVEFHAVDVAATLYQVNRMSSADVAVLRAYLNGMAFTCAHAYRWSSDGSDACQLCGSTDSAWHRLYECDATSDLRAQVSSDFWQSITRVPQALSLHGWELQAPQKLQWLRYLNDISDSFPLAFVDVTGPVVDLFVDGSCFFEVPFKTAAWSVIRAPAPSLATSTAEDFQVVASGWVPGCIQTSHRAELWALLGALHYSATNPGVVRVWSDCQSVVDNFNLFGKGCKALKSSCSHFDLWLRIQDYIEQIGKNRIFVAKVPGHEDLDSAETDLERWAYLGNALADTTAKATNLDRPESVWNLWRDYQQSVQQLSTMGNTVRTLMVQVSRRWQEQGVVENPVTFPSRPVKQGRVFSPEWSGFVLVQNVTGVWHRRFHTFESQFLRWWNTNTACEAQPQWISFAHLYIDWMMSTGHAGVIRLGKKWYDSAEDVGIAIEQYSFRLRIKLWRLCIQQFLKDVGITAGTATCRPFSRSLQIFVGCLSVPWPAHRIAAIDDWMELHLGSVIRGKPSILDRLRKPDSILGLDP